ncbi:uncharacterized protein E0L32_010799 [Thyridium curvatum]|uniref:Methyltransferase type 12 domain-containing protein n=1 Tax=Thyridium curvatum TaxID=1093900 RepID=A0A507AFC7_9PEZI|nr:uncharacterized protein E0L32_010799 [Thyridium curvatum]TPX07302.1 hypothetical protein E0L32_010799 [Thyridium curvatum]
MLELFVVWCVYPSEENETPAFVETGHWLYFHQIERDLLLKHMMDATSEKSIVVGKYLTPSGRAWLTVVACGDPDFSANVRKAVIDCRATRSIDFIELVRAVGSELAACLTGEKDALQILFGDPATRAVLEDAYDRWPLFRAPGWVLGDFVERALTAKSSASTGDGSGGKFRILEVGAGTGGTTKVVVERLRSLGVPFEYVFTDISTSLVGTAAKRAEFADLAGDGKMCFKVLDIEQPPKPEDVAAYYIVLASNAIHATRDLGTSLGHLRAMLSDDGALTLLEITRNMSWLDVVFGPLEG